MLEGLSYTDWLLIAVLWFQIANLLFQLWPKLMQYLPHRLARTSEKKTEGLDSYEQWKHDHGEEKHE